MGKRQANEQEKKQQASPAKALHPRLILHDTAISMYIAGIPRYTP